MQSPPSIIFSFLRCVFIVSVILAFLPPSSAETHPSATAPNPASEEATTPPAAGTEGEGGSAQILPGSTAELVAMLPSELVAQPWETGRLITERIVSQSSFDGPDFQNALLIAARYAASQMQHGEAILYYERWRLSATGNSRMPQVLVELGRQYRETGLIKNALDYFYRAIRLARGEGQVGIFASKVAQWEIAETLYRSHEWERARKLFEMFVEANEAADLLTQSALYRMGDCSRALGNENQAIVDYQRALAHNDRHPFSLEAHLALLEIFLERDNHELAHRNLLELARAVSRLTPAEGLYWKRRSGEVLFREMVCKRSFQLSSAILEALAKADDSPAWQAQLSFWKGLTNIGVGQWKDALVDFTNVPPAIVKDTPTLSSASEYADDCRWILNTMEKEKKLNLPELTQ